MYCSYKKRSLTMYGWPRKYATHLNCEISLVEFLSVTPSHTVRVTGLPEVILCSGRISHLCLLYEIRHAHACA